MSREAEELLAPEGTESIEDAQREESLARLEAARAGDIELIDHDDAMRMIAG